MPPLDFTPLIYIGIVIGILLCVGLGVVALLCHYLIQHLHWIQ
jgi:hypothetical protein